MLRGACHISEIQQRVQSNEQVQIEAAQLSATKPRVLAHANTGTLRQSCTPGSAINPGYNYRLPLWSVFPYNVSTPALGIVRGALEAYVAYIASRPERANMAQRQLRISESAAEVDAAEALWLSNAATLERSSLFVLRAVQGVGLGGEVPIAAALFNECIRGQTRGKVVMAYESVYVWGILLAR